MRLHQRWQAALVAGSLLAFAAGCDSGGASAGADGGDGSDVSAPGSGGSGGAGAAAPDDAGGGGGGAGGDGGGAGATPASDAAPPAVASDPGDPQTPPIGEANVKAWLAANHYKAWKCESGPRNPRPPSTHGTNRVCSNAILSAHGGGEYPAGAAAVVELYDNSVEKKLVGHGVSRHVRAGTETTSWYWYANLGGVFFGDGLGLGACASCHGRAGIDMATPGHDFVFVQVN